MIRQWEDVRVGTFDSINEIINVNGEDDPLISEKLIHPSKIEN